MFLEDFAILPKNIVVIGDIILDFYIFGEVKRFSSEAPIPIFDQTDEGYKLGGAANVALNLKAANQNVRLISVVGNDDRGSLLLDLIKKENVSTDDILKDNRRTTTKTRFVSGKNIQVFRHDNEDGFPISDDVEELIVNKLTTVITNTDLIVISDYLKGVITEGLVKKIVQLAKKFSIPVIADVKPYKASKYGGCFVVKPNLKELRDIAKKNVFEISDILETGYKLCKEHQFEYVVTTLGDRGIACVSYYGESFYIPAINTNRIDVSGAGDTVIAYLAVGLANSFKIYDCLCLANCAGGKKVSKFGVVPVDIKELEAYDTSNCKIIKADQLFHLRKKYSGKKIVFTNGCFDLLHFGHVKSLFEASKFGDVLVVGINSDDSVKRLKGEGRPINSLKDRMDMLAAYNFVDFIIPFDDDTPYEIIRTLLPDIIVKGTDYKNKKIIGEDIVKVNGGEVRFVENIPDISTSEIIKKINENK